MKKPIVTGDALEAIIAQHPTPFHIYSEAGIRGTARALQGAFAWNAGFKEYFAVKATPNPAILKILRQEGCGVDCASLTELMLAEACGFKGHEIMFSSNVTPAEEYAYAAKLGAIINLDDISHIDFLERAAGKIPQTICCRYNPGGDFKIHNKIMDSPKDAKYGFTKQQLREGYVRLRAKGTRAFGLHAFLASNTLGDEYYPVLARELFEVAVWLKEETGIALGFINLSGGVGIPYRPEDAMPDITAIGRGVQKAFDEVLAPAGLGGVAIFTELGHFVLGPNGQLVATVLHKKQIYK
ncbi:MAG: diaminopimelate decarboxylase, partial [Oscillospiraceae bacterium]